MEPVPKRRGYLLGAMVSVAIDAIGFAQLFQDAVDAKLTIFLGTVAFGVFMYKLAASYKEELELLLEQTPHLSLVFRRAPPYIHDKPTQDGQILRIFRVGIRNTGGSANDVRLRLNDVSPNEPMTGYVGHELAVMGQPQGVMTAIVHHSEDPAVFFDVVGQVFTENMASTNLHMRFAAAHLFGRQFSGADVYRLTIAIDGPGVVEGPEVFIVEKDTEGRQWEMKTAQ